MSEKLIPALLVVIVSTSSASAAYDGSWTNDYTWTALTDQTVTAAPTTPTVYRGNTVFQSAVGGTGNAQAALFSGGTVDFPAPKATNALINDKGAFRLAVTDGAAVTLTARQGWYSSDCHFELVDGSVSGEGGIQLGGQYGKDSTIDIYGGTWTAPVAPNNWNSSDLEDKPAVRVYGGVFAPTSLLPVNTGYQYRRSTVVMAGGTFVCPSLKMADNRMSRVTWFATEEGTESVLKLGAASVTWSGKFTSGAASVVRLQQNETGRAECLSLATNLVGSGEIRLEGPSLDLSGADCTGFSGSIVLKAGQLFLGTARHFGEGTKIVLDVVDGGLESKPVSWDEGNPPIGATFELDAASKAAGARLHQAADGIFIFLIQHTYDGSWTNDYTWTALTDQTVTAAPTTPTVYRGNTVFQSAVGGTGNAQAALFSGGTVDFPAPKATNALINDKGAFRLAVTDGAAVTLTARQGWYSSDCHFELVDGSVSGEGGIQLGGQYGKDSTIDIYGGTWTAPVAPNNWNSSDLEDKPAVRVYGGVFAPTSLLPVNTGYQYRRSTVVMAGGTFVCPLLKMADNRMSRVTWFATEEGTESVLKLGAASVTWSGKFTSGAASVVRLQQNETGRAECLSLATNLVGSGEIRLEGPSLDLSGADCTGFSGSIVLKAGQLFLGTARHFGERCHATVDYPVGTSSAKVVGWVAGNPPDNVTFVLSDALKLAEYTISVDEDGVRLHSNRGLVLTFR